MEKFRQNLCLVQSDAAQVFGVDGDRHVLGHDRASATRSHDRYQNVVWADRISPERLEFPQCYIAPLTPFESIVDGIVDAEDGHALIDELGMQELAPERTSPHVDREPA